MGASGLPVAPATITWLRDFFEQQGLVNPYGFVQYAHARGRAILPEEEPSDVERLLAQIERKRWLAVSYDRVRVYFWMLRLVEAIEFDHEEPSQHGQPRRFYRMTKPEWFIPGLQTHFYPATALGAMRYRGGVQRRDPVQQPAPPEGEQNPQMRGRKYWEEPERSEEELPNRARRRPRRERGT